MGFVGSLLGTAGGAAGTGFAAPTGTNPTDLARAQQNALAGINQQQSFLNALNPGALQALQSQQGLLNQLQQGAQGQGPNPALAQLNQTTAQNTANQAALMAGQRGAAANPALIARQAAMQGAANQQQAAGQAATLAAQQQIAQEQMLQAQQQAMAGQQQAGLNAYNQAANTQQGNLLGMQANINNANAQLAGNVMPAQQNLFGGLMNTGVGAGAKLLSGLGGGGTAAGGTALAGGAGDVGGAASTLPVDVASEGSMLAAEGGKIPKKMAAGGDLMPVAQPGVSPMDQIADPSKPSSAFGNFLQSQINPVANTAKKAPAASSSNPFGGLMSAVPGVAGGYGQALSVENPQFGMSGILGHGIANMGTKTLGLASGGKVPVLLSPGEKVLSPEKAKKAADGKISPMAEGKKVPGKPKVGGAKNDYANDTHKDALEPGSVVLPRSVTQSKDAEKKAIAFIQAVMAKHGGMK